MKEMAPSSVITTLEPEEWREAAHPESLLLEGRSAPVPQPGRTSIAPEAVDEFSVILVSSLATRTIQGGVTRRDRTTEASARTALMLTRDAYSQFWKIRDSGEVNWTRSTYITFARMLRILVRDGGPLPQLSPSATGGLEVLWLVGGTQVGLVVDDSGDWLLWGENDRGDEMFDEEGRLGWPLSTQTRSEALRTLAEMGASVRFWPRRQTQ